MFAFSANYLTSFDPGDLLAQDALWYDWCVNQTIRDHPKMLYWCGNLQVDVDRDLALATWIELPSRQLGLRIIWTYTSLGIAVLVGIASYIGFLFAEPARYSRTVLKSWWRVFQWPVHFALFCFVSGCFLFMYTNSAVVRISYPDPAMLIGFTDYQTVWTSVQMFQWIIVYIIIGATGYQVVAMFLWVNAHVAKKAREKKVARSVLNALKFKATTNKSSSTVLQDDVEGGAGATNELFA